MEFSGKLAKGPRWRLAERTELGSLGCRFRAAAPDLRGQGVREEWPCCPDALPAGKAT